MGLFNLKKMWIDRICANIEADLWIKEQEERARSEAPKKIPYTPDEISKMCPVRLVQIFSQDPNDWLHPEAIDAARKAIWERANLL